MDIDILFRLLMAVGLAGAGYLAYRLVNHRILARAGSKTPELPGVHPGAPILLYFTTPTCAPCKTVQRPAIQRLSERLGDCLQVVEIDASSQPELASRWGVMSVPTTFVIDEKGEPRFVNHGVANLDKLLNQFETITSTC
jgi:thiol-disulfide isomerase/thioredoxin